MSVELDPVELGFQRPFTREVSRVLRLKNPHSEPVAFKVKTTAPKQYCVRPNSGRIEAGGVVEVQVLLQAMKEDPPLDAKCRDKFLVQSVAITSDKEFTNISHAWAAIETNNKSAIHEKKIRVSFLPADASQAAPGVAHTPARQSTGGDAHDASTQPYSSPMSTAATPQTHNTYVNGAQSNTNGADRGVVAAAGGAIAGAAGAVAAAVPTSQEELKAQLEQAKAQIASLTRQAQEQTGLRQRRTERPESTATLSDPPRSMPTIMAMQAAPSGVPVPLVAALCLLSFLLAYIFF